MNKKSGFREIDHTADLELQVWAPDIPGLIVQSAKGMYASSKTHLAPQPRVTREIALPLIDNESLIVDFLSELLFFAEHEEIGFDNIQVDVSGDHYMFTLSGNPIVQQAKEIKAVTFHGMQVKETDKGVEVNIVFDI